MSITEEQLIKGKCYKMLINGYYSKLNEYAGKVTKEVMTKLGAHSMEGTGEMGEFHSFPDRPGSAVSTSFPVGHFNKYGITFIEEECAPKTMGGRRRKRKTVRRGRSKSTRKRK
jgi:hypothetical protein